MKKIIAPLLLLTMLIPGLDAGRKGNLRRRGKSTRKARAAGHWQEELIQEYSREDRLLDEEFVLVKLIYRCGEEEWTPYTDLIEYNRSCCCRTSRVVSKLYKLSPLVKRAAVYISKRPYDRFTEDEKRSKRLTRLLSAYKGYVDNTAVHLGFGSILCLCSFWALNPLEVCTAEELTNQEAKCILTP